MSVKRQTEHHLEFLSLKGGFTGSSESTLGNHMPRLNYSSSEVSDDPAHLGSPARAFVAHTYTKGDIDIESSHASLD